MEDKLEIFQDIVDDAKKHGFDVRIRDIAYANLVVSFNDADTAYLLIFGQPASPTAIESYSSLDSVKYLIGYFQRKIAPPKTSKDDDVYQQIIKNKTSNEIVNDITFEENKSAMIDLIERVETALAENKIDTDKGLKIISDVRVKLNDKFGAAEKTNEQYLFVQPKFNSICPHTRRECWLQTKAYAMEHWHLVPDPNYKEL